jgi:flagellar hook-basal body complex protein FliE
MMIAALHTTNIANAALPNATASITQLPGAARDATKLADSPFGEFLSDAVGKVGQLEDQARTAVEGLMTGSGVDVHQAMIASEKASMAFEMALAVRNKAIQSYQSVMSMQF